MHRKDAKAYRDAEETEHEAYFNTIIEEIIEKLGEYNERDPEIKSLLKSGPKRFQRHKKLIRMSDGTEVGIYEGQWAENDFSDEYLLRREMRHGFGVFMGYTSGSYYVGQWVCDKKNGLGRMIEPDGSIYEG